MQKWTYISHPHPDKWCECRVSGAPGLLAVNPNVTPRGPRLQPKCDAQLQPKRDARLGQRAAIRFRAPLLHRRAHSTADRPMLHMERNKHLSTL